MRGIISIVALACAVICFGVYFWLTVHKIPAEAEKTRKAIRELQPSEGGHALSATDLPDLIKALATLVEGLVKAGPALWSLVGSILFLLIAAFVAGVYPGG